MKQTHKGNLINKNKLKKIAATRSDIMAKRPSFQFYPGDHTSNTNLKRCTFEEKGVWMDLLCLFHDSDDYGMLKWPLSEIALAIGCNINILISLTQKNILKGDDSPKEKVSFFTPITQKNRESLLVELISENGPLWYSSRMVRDEYIRQKRAKHQQNIPMFLKRNKKKRYPSRHPLHLRLYLHHLITKKERDRIRLYAQYPIISQ